MTAQPPHERKVSVHIMLRPATDRLLSRLAAHDGMTRSDTVEELIAERGYTLKLISETPTA